MIVGKRKLYVTLAVVLLLGVFVHSAAAAVDVAASDLTIPVDYEKLKDNDKTISFDKTVKLTNNGNAAENITLSFENVPSDYTFSVSPASLTLAANASQDVTVSGKAPVNVDQGTHDVAALKVSTASGQASTHTFKTDVAPMVEIKKLDVYINGYKEKSIDEDDETVKDVMPGDEIELKFTLENLFDEDYDEGDVDGELTVQLDDGGFGEDIDEEESYEVQANEEEEITFTFIVPLDVEDDDFTLDIKLEGKDDNKAAYEENWKLTMEVERRKNDVRIDSLTVSPAEVSCVRKVQLSAKVANYGSNNQKHTSLTIENSNLGINSQYSFNLARGSSSDNSDMIQFYVDIDNDVTAGTYPILATAYYEFDVPNDKKTVDLVVKDCAAEETSASETAEEVTEKTKNISIATAGAGTTTTTAAAEKGVSSEGNKISAAIVKTVEDPYTTSDVVVALLIIAFILVSAVIVLFFIILLKRK